MSPDSHYSDSNAGHEWGTPPEIWQPLADALGGFDLDPASGAEPEPIADTRYTIEDDGLSHEWFGDVWLNPPYGRGINKEWAQYAHAQAHNADYDGNLLSLTALVPASTATQWFQSHYAKAHTMTLVNGRVDFIGGDHNATFGNAIVTFGMVNQKYFDALEDLGEVWTHI